ncbi:TRAP transporter substrate-binding protein [Chelativorans sp.]|uniref:TRAP transporter substrate-binding protein n=1 Tax=Chelativorans sp. TaxID=2203393 RepID=UPI002810D3B7|nr:TRAP transporter substrate-binding protein [Chelativorans sp.]
MKRGFLRTIGAICLAATALASIAQVQAADVTIRVASAFNDGTDMIRAAMRFGEIVEEKSGGAIDVQFFANGQMGGEKDNLEALKIGEIEMGVFGTYPIVTLAPAYSFFDAPFVFRDKDHFYAVYKGELGDGVRKIFKEQNGIHELGIMGRGYRHITSNKPIEFVDDLAGVKMRMGQSKPFIEAFAETGAVVVPIALPELFTSLKLGVVSASEGPYDQIYTFKLHEAQSHLAITGHLYATSLWLMNQEFYDGLSEEHRKIVDEAAAEALALGDKMSEESAEQLLAKLQEEGMTVTKPDYAAFMQKVRPAIDRLFAQDWTVTTAAAIEAVK